MNNIMHCYINGIKFTLIDLRQDRGVIEPFSIQRDDLNYWIPVSILKSGVNTIKADYWTEWYERENLDNYKLALQKFEKCMTLL